MLGFYESANVEIVNDSNETKNMYFLFEDTHVLSQRNEKSRSLRHFPASNDEGF
jgi:hypothetical protein